MDAKEFVVFEGKRTLSIPMDVLKQYNNMVGTFKEHTANYFVLVLDLSEDMSDKELSQKVIDAMLEDCEASVDIAKALLTPKNLEGLLEKDAED